VSFSSGPHARTHILVDFLLKWGVIKKKVDVKDLVTNEFIDEINKFNPNQIAAEAKTYKPR